MNTKVKAVDLGALQDTFIKTKVALASDARAYARAEEALARSRKAFETADATLKAAVKVVFAQP